VHLVVDHSSIHCAPPFNAGCGDIRDFTVSSLSAQCWLPRGLITLLAAVLPRWREALLLVKSETVLRWHSEGFRLLC
jgi:hypothetical protein